MRIFIDVFEITRYFISRDIKIDGLVLNNLVL